MDIQNEIWNRDPSIATNVSYIENKTRYALFNK